MFEALFTDGPAYNPDQDPHRFLQKLEHERVQNKLCHQKTFVGTPLYISPEMIDNNTCGPFTDLWSLGIIIFEMFTGEVPFKGKDEIDLFQNIMDPYIRPNYPSNMPADAVDLVDKILNPNPIERLGYETEDSKNGYNVLKSHQFFDGIDFE